VTKKGRKDNQGAREFLLRGKKRKKKKKVNPSRPLLALERKKRGGKVERENGLGEKKKKFRSTQYSLERRKRGETVKKKAVDKRF